MENKILELTKQLIAIPSWVDDRTNETAIGQFIYNYLKSNSQLQVTKQVVYKGRFNVIAQNAKVIDTLIVGHIDTVQPSQSWTKQPINPEAVGNRLYGLGSSDMKSGVAAMLALASNDKLPAGTMFLFYVDEEYDFFGMKSFIKSYRKKINPRRIISLDGSDLSITNGCRGLIEITATLKGKSGHASRPQSGVNAITKTNLIISNLTNWLGNFVNNDLGPTVSNIAYISGGQYQGESDDNLILGRQGNVIADICQFTIDIRPSRPELNAKKVIQYIRREANKYRLTLKSYEIRHDLGSWLTGKEELPTDLGLPFKAADQTGYIDVQMLWQTFNQVPSFTIGAGKVNMAHKPDEFIEINKLNKLIKILNTIIFNNI